MNHVDNTLAGLDPIRHPAMGYLDLNEWAKHLEQLGVDTKDEQEKIYKTLLVTDFLARGLTLGVSCMAVGYVLQKTAGVSPFVKKPADVIGIFGATLTAISALSLGILKLGDCENRDCLRESLQKKACSLQERPH